MAYLDQFLQAIVTQGASDLHIGEGQPPKMRRHGDIMAMRPEPVLRDEAVLMLREIAGPANWNIFQERGDHDFAYEMDRASRFRKSSSSPVPQYRVTSKQLNHARPA